MKNQKLRQLISIVMVSVLALSFITGCGKSSAPNSSSNNVDPTNSASDSDLTSKEASGDITLPLTDDPITITLFTKTDSNSASSDYNDNLFFQELEKRTGIHVDFQVAAVGQEATAFNLMISSGQLTDIVSYANYYSDGMDAAIEDGYYLDLTPYMEEYMPNYMKRVSELDPQAAKNVVTDTGKYAGIYNIRLKEQGPWGGLQLRKDWLNDLGLDIPVTYDDWEVMLTAFKEEKGAYAPLALCSGGYMPYTDALSAGFGASSTFQKDEEGTVTYGPMTEGWKQYLEKMSDWYAKGLIDPDYMTSGSSLVDTGKVLSGQSGAWQSMYTMASLYENAVDGMEVIAVSAPKVNKEDKVHIRMPDTYMDTLAFSISADTKYPELCMKWLDYLFSEEGSLLANYGVEGIGFNYDTDGKIQISDNITNNPDGLSVSQAQAFYTLPPSTLPCNYDLEREMAAIPEKDIKSYDIWSADDYDYVLPGFMTFTSDEAIEKAAILADITTYVSECTNKFITGVMDIDTDWDTYVSTLKSMNIDRAIEINQAAYDRYESR